MKNKFLKINFLCATMLVSVIIQASNTIPPIVANRPDSLIQKDEMTRVYLSPVKIVWINDGGGQLIQNSHRLLCKGDGQAEMGKRDMMEVKHSGTDIPSVLLDFGFELHGGLQIVLGGSSRRKPQQIRIRFGESVGECNSATLEDDWKVNYSTNDHVSRDVTLRVSRNGSSEYGNTGFRFVRLDFLEPNVTTYVKEIRAILRYRDIPYLGSFQSSDERLNKIWMTGAYTVHLNMQEYLWDGIKRDRLIWLGDMHPEISTLMCVFGNHQIVEKTLDKACEQYPLPGWMNGMSAYSMWYLIIHYEWYMYGGDMNFLQKHKAYIQGLVDLIASKIHQDGNEDLSPARFLDWPSSPNPKGVESGYRALLSWALDDAAKLAGFLDLPQMAQTASDAQKRLNKRILPPNNLKQAAALMAIAGTMKAEKACKEVVSVGGPKGFSTFYGYYMLQALAKAGKYQEAMDIIRQYWGGMLDMGATTFWEDFNLDWKDNAARLDELTPVGKKDIHGDFGAYCYPGYRHSLCHAWSSGPTAWMTHQVMGVEFLEPGCRKILVNPHLGDLKWVKGTFPTPYGIVNINIDKDEVTGKANIRFEKPAEVTIVTNENK